MAVAAELVEQRRGELRSFDPLASVDMLQFDLLTQNTIRPETMQRVIDEELTYIAEGIDRPLKTSFTLKEVNGQLSYFDSGDWRPYTGMLMTGLAVAEQEALQDSRTSFLAERAAEDLAVGYRMQSLQPGERLSWHSPFPEAELQQYGADFLRHLGFQPQRKMGFLYQATKLADGSVRLDSQSVDANNPQGYRAALLLAERNPLATIDDMRQAYDKVMQLQSGERHYAGKQVGTERCDDAWQLLRQQQDLVDYLLDGIVAIAENTELTRYEQELAKKELTYGVWAAVKSRIDASTSAGRVATDVDGYYNEAMIHNEVQVAFARLQARGEVLVGCGGAIGSKAESLLTKDPSAVFDDIFGESEQSEEKYDFDKEMYCVVCQAPPKHKDEDKKMCGPCGICKGCDSKLSGKIK